MHLRAQSPNVRERRARHVARWLAAPPGAASSSEVSFATPHTHPSPTQSMVAPEANEKIQDLRHVHMHHQYVAPPANGPRGRPPRDAPPALGSDGAKPVKGGAKGVFSVGVPNGTLGGSGVSLGGVSGVSDVSSIGGTSLGGMHHANAARIKESAGLLRRAAASRQFSKERSAPNEPAAPPVDQHTANITQRAQDTRIGLPTSTQGAAEGVAQQASIASDSLCTASFAFAVSNESVQQEAHPEAQERQEVAHPMRHPVCSPRIRSGCNV